MTSFDTEYGQFGQGRTLKVYQMSDELDYLNVSDAIFSIVSKTGNATSDRKSDFRFGFLGSN